jgi:YidC/Oxa1 family membrane protein insertase
MPGWAFVVDLVRALVFSAAHVCGGSIGGGILLVSTIVRIALLPLTLRMARRMMAHQAKLTALKPELERLEGRHGKGTPRLAEATVEFYREHDVSVLPPGTLKSALVQIPIGAALYRAFSSGMGPRLKFLWIGDLARPDALVALAAAGLAGVAAATSTPTSNRVALTSGAITLFFAWRLSASVGLYWVASNGVGVAQSLILRRSRA